MIPFCRTVDEAKNVIKQMKEFGLKRGENGLEIYMMVEIPSNVILAEQFLNRQTIGNAFVKLPDEFTLDDGRKVFIYRKERKFTSEELLKISQMFTEFYPNNKEKFEISPEMVKEFGEN